MPHNVRVNKQLGIIEVEAFGVLEKENILATFAEISRLAESEGIKKILADTTKVERVPGTGDTFNLFSQYPTGFKHAILAAPASVESGPNDLQFIENLSVNRGRQTKVFYDREAALQWLL